MGSDNMGTEGRGTGMAHPICMRCACLVKGNGLEQRLWVEALVLP